MIVAESNENLLHYGLLKHVHMPEIAKTIERLSSGSAAGVGVHAPLGADDPRRTRHGVLPAAALPRASAWTRPGASTPGGRSSA